MEASTNSYVNTTSAGLMLKNGPLITAVFVIAYLVIFLAGFIGNTLVCLIVARNAVMYNVTNCFIVNLAVADILVSIFCMPITLVANILEGWPFGLVMCKLTPVIQGISVAASIFTLTVIAVDRHNNIVNPLRPRMEYRTACVSIVIIWALAVAIMVPQGVVLQVETYEVKPGLKLNYCDETGWPTYSYRRAFTCSVFLLTYLLPLIIISIAYVRIARKVWTRNVPGASEETPATGNAQATISKQKIKVVKMILVVVITFGVSYLPLHACVLLAEFGAMTQDQFRILLLYCIPIAHWLAFSQSSVNPIVYGYYSNNFRRGFRSVMRPTQFCNFGSVEMSASGPRETDRLRP
ncbi:neuropeptide FF receptor 2-like [Ptychodera flava]|uniref:neuropeptide FF receptor 2-like n=1 Tax=Ptychodera flava TaxID=63121 RepID=UPI003969F924